MLCKSEKNLPLPPPPAPAQAQLRMSQSCPSSSTFFLDGSYHTKPQIRHGLNCTAGHLLTASVCSSRYDAVPSRPLCFVFRTGNPPSPQTLWKQCHSQEGTVCPGYQPLEGAKRTTVAPVSAALISDIPQQAGEPVEHVAFRANAPHSLQQPSRRSLSAAKASPAAWK